MNDAVLLVERIEDAGGALRLRDDKIVYVVGISPFALFGTHLPHGREIHYDHRGKSSFFSAALVPEHALGLLFVKC